MAGIGLGIARVVLGLLLLPRGLDLALVRSYVPAMSHHTRGLRRINLLIRFSKSYCPECILMSLMGLFMKHKNAILSRVIR